MSDALKSFNDRRADDMARHHERFACEHDHTAITRRVIRGGSVQYVRQCSNCGAAASNPVSAQVALRESGGSIGEFDISIQAAWDARRSEAFAEIERKYSRQAFLSQYDTYLSSDDWRRRRARVLLRAAGVCEGCGLGEPTQVHHLTYKHVGFEFLFELVALCGPCHDRIHEGDDRWPAASADAPPP